MTDEELRAMVRAAIAQHAGEHGGRREASPPAPVRQHASHQLFVLVPAGSDTDGPCLIEPSVVCNHCGYCQSYGH